MALNHASHEKGAECNEQPRGVQHQKVVAQENHYGEEKTKEMSKNKKDHVQVRHNHSNTEHPPRQTGQDPARRSAATVARARTASLALRRLPDPLRCRPVPPPHRQPLSRDAEGARV